MPNNNEDEFEQIIKNSGLEDAFSEYHHSVLTLGDLYEGLVILSSVQADLHNYLRDVVRAIQENNRAGDKIYKIPQLTASQAGYLSNLFEIGELFLEEHEVE